jgi:hypothetical protein
MVKIIKRLGVVLFLALLLSGCSKGKKNNRYGTNEVNFQKKRSPRDNNFIENGGYKANVPKKMFLTSQEATEVYNKDAKDSKNSKDTKDSLKDVPQTPKEFSKINR